MSTQNIDLADSLQNQVLNAYQHHIPLQIVGGNSKPFYGRTVAGESLNVAGHLGIVSYDPTELVMTARTGTPLSDVKAALAVHNQMLAFEPPQWGAAGTLGGTIACNLSGPRRPYAGAARDFLLGCEILNGTGERLRFGGQVIKNVAGYDASRLMAGALGTLGVLLEVSLKVLPAPSHNLTLVRSCPHISDALNEMNTLAGKPLPISASAWVAGELFVRFSGSSAAMDMVQQNKWGEALPNDDNFWEQIKEWQHPYFSGDFPLWRIGLPQTAPHLDLAGEWLIEWGGAQRWLRSDLPAYLVRERIAALGGHASILRNVPFDEHEVFHPLNPAMLKLQQNIKQSFDPAGILNPQRMYREL